MSKRLPIPSAVPVALLVWLLAATAAAAAEPAASADELEDLSLEELLDIRVVTASKYAQDQDATPTSVTVVTRQDIERFGFRTVADVLRTVRGFYVSDSREYEFVGVRGFSLPRDFNTRLLLLVNGQRINEPIYSQVGVGFDFPIDVSWVKRIEIVRGPSSSIYGSSAFFAVVNVITFDPEDVGGARVAGTLGSLGTEGLTGGYGGRVGPVGLLASATTLSSDGERIVFARPFASPETGDGFAKDADGEWYERGFAEVRLSDLSLQAFASRGRDHHPIPRFGTIFGDRGFTYDETWLSTALAYQHDFDGGESIASRVYVMRYAFEGRYPFAYYGPELPRIFNRDDQSASWWGGELQGSVYPWASLRTTAGVELRHTFDLDQKNFDALPDAPLVYIDTSVTELVLGAYTQLDWDPVDWATLSAGGRYDFIRSRSPEIGDFEQDDDRLSPRAGLVLRPFDSSAVKLNYGEAFRAPNSYERFYQGGDPSAGAANLFNPDLEPETIRTVELVLEQRFGDDVRALASGYYYQTDNLILDTIVDDLGNSQFQNFAGVEAQGLELEAEGRWRNLVQGRLSYGLQRAESRDSGAALGNSPTHLIQLQVAVPLKGEKLVVAGDARGVTERKLEPGRSVSGHVIGNVTVSSAGLVDGLRVSTSVRNLGDTLYADPFPGGDVPETPQIGRTFWLTVAYDYAL